MALSLTFSAAVLGIDGYVVRIEADQTAGNPTFVVVGLPDRALGEARERVRAAIFNSGYAFPAGRVLVNLSPTDVPMYAKKALDSTCPARSRCSEWTTKSTA